MIYVGHAHPPPRRTCGSAEAITGVRVDLGDRRAAPPAYAGVPFDVDAAALPPT
jgi:hypothetical protein